MRIQYYMFLVLISVTTLQAVNLVEGWTFQAVMHTQRMFFLTSCFWGCDIALFHNDTVCKKSDMVSAVSNLGQQELHRKGCAARKVAKFGGREVLKKEN